MTFFCTGIPCKLFRSIFQAEYATHIKNTLLYIGLILIFDLLVNSMCGYALAKFEFKGKGAILNLVIALMVLPMEAIMLPLYIEMSQLGWVNTLAALVVPFLAKCSQFICSDRFSATYRMT